MIGRFDESLAELRRARELDPLSIIIDADLETIFLFSRQYDEAIRQNRKILEMDSRFVFAYLDLSLALQQSGRSQEAITELKKALSLESENPFVLSLMGYTYARMGEKKKAKEFCSNCKNCRSASMSRPCISPESMPALEIETRLLNR